MNEKSRSGYLVKRVFAYGIDWYFTAVIANIISVLFNSLIFKESLPIKPTDQSKILWFILACFIASLFTYVYIPLKRKSNQTIMQKVLQLEVVSINGEKLSLKNHLIRFFVGCFIVESALYICSAQFTSYILYLIFPLQIQTYISYLLVAISIGSMIFAFADKKNNQTFHDKISNSKVIDVSFLDKGKKLL